MQDVRGVHSFQGAESLINEVLAVVVRKILCTNDTVHVGLHQLLSCRQRPVNYSANELVPE
jgi:hypothetical protein